jgi:hypothetical protein
MRVDFRWLLKDGNSTLQWREGAEKTVSNPNYDKDSERPDTGKYTTKISWGKWKNVRLEEDKPKKKVIEESFDTDQSLLALASKQLPWVTWNSWSSEQRAQAANWAAATHLRASDNNNRVPPMPEHVKPLPNLTMENRPLPKYGDLMKREEFVERCKNGFFVDYDGHGYYASETEMSDVLALPSDVTHGKVFHGFSHVMWFNK